MVAAGKQLRKPPTVDRIGHSVYYRPSGPGYLIGHPEAFGKLFSRIFDAMRYFALQWFAVADKFIGVGRKTNTTKHEGTETMFATTAAAITTNAATYKNLATCKAMGTRLKRAYERAGSYGNQYHIYRDALWAIQLRAAELIGMEQDRKWATA